MSLGVMRDVRCIIEQERLCSFPLNAELRGGEGLMVEQESGRGQQPQPQHQTLIIHTK